MATACSNLHFWKCLLWPCAAFNGRGKRVSLLCFWSSNHCCPIWSNWLSLVVDIWIWWGLKWSRSDLLNDLSTWSTSHKPFASKMFRNVQWSSGRCCFDTSWKVRSWLIALSFSVQTWRNTGSLLKLAYVLLSWGTSEKTLGQCFWYALPIVEKLVIQDFI